MERILQAPNMQLACRPASDRFYLLVVRAVLRCPLKFARKLKSLVKQLDNRSTNCSRNSCGHRYGGR
jgi:hypothetical protein